MELWTWLFGGTAVTKEKRLTAEAEAARVSS